MTVTCSDDDRIRSIQFLVYQGLSACRVGALILLPTDESDNQGQRYGLLLIAVFGQYKGGYDEKARVWSLSIRHELHVAQPGRGLF